MLIKNGTAEELGHSDLTDFLDIVYGYGAKRQFIARDGYFATQLSSGEFTNTLIDRLLRLSSDYYWLNSYASQHEFGASGISA